jgi:hypothetical protein
MTYTHAALLVSAFLLLPTAPVLAGVPGAPVCGDVNDSGGVNTTDALLTLRYAVDQPVTLDCSGFEGEIDECEEERVSCMNGLVQCINGLKCGDGLLNSVGEHCDDADLGETTCESLGFAGGTLACDESCKFDTSGCSACPEGSHLFNGVCMIIGTNPVDGNGSCDAACESIGLECDEAVLDAINTSDESCRNAIDAADPFAAPHAISSLSPQTQEKCGPPSDYAGGCTYFSEAVVEEENGAVRWTYAGSPVLCAADFDGGFCTTPAHRVCACSRTPADPE